MTCKNSNPGKSVHTSSPCPVGVFIEADTIHRNGFKAHIKGGGIILQTEIASGLVEKMGIFIDGCFKRQIFFGKGFHTVPFPAHANVAGNKISLGALGSSSRMPTSSDNVRCRAVPCIGYGQVPFALPSSITRRHGTELANARSTCSAGSTKMLLTMLQSRRRRERGTGYLVKYIADNVSGTGMSSNTHPRSPSPVAENFMQVIVADICRAWSVTAGVWPRRRWIQAHVMDFVELDTVVVAHEVMPCAGHYGCGYGRPVAHPLQVNAGTVHAVPAPVIINMVVLLVSGR